jgi:hypothetical protein
MAQNILVEVSLVIDLVDELVDTGRSLGSGALERLWADNLAIVDDEFLIERGYQCQSNSRMKNTNLPYFCISMVRAASVSLMRSNSAETA